MPEIETMSAMPETDAETDNTPPAHKPAFLRRVIIEGYKSIAHCDVTLEPLTIFVGRNASGKSNFLDALDFLIDLSETNISEAIRARGGWKVIADRTSPNKRIKLGVELQWDREHSPLIANYKVHLESGENQIGEAVEESLSIRDECSETEWGYNRVRGKFQESGDWNHPEDQGLMNLIPNLKSFSDIFNDTLFINMFCKIVFSGNLKLFRPSVVYDFVPSRMRPPQPTAGYPILMRDGRNLARAIAGLAELDIDKIERIKSYLNVIVPGVVNFWQKNYGDHETVRFAIQANENSPLVEFDAHSMSDGTLRVLASLVAVSQTFLPEGDPGFIAIEEPETAIHPAALHVLMDAMDEATLHTQVLLTTHSTEILDSPVVKPENIRVVRLIDGHTVIGKLDGGSVEIVRQNLDTLGGLERQNQLDIDESLITQHTKPHQVNGRESP